MFNFRKEKLDYKKGFWQTPPRWLGISKDYFTGCIQIV